MPELFRCDMDEFFATCEVYADSPALRGLLVVSEEGEPGACIISTWHTRGRC